MSVLTEDGERKQQVLEHLGADLGTFGLGPGLNGLQVTLVHPHLHLLRHAVGTVKEREEREKMRIELLLLKSQNFKNHFAEL